MNDSMPKVITSALVIGAMVLLIPLAIAFKSRYSKTPNPPVHPIQDMDVQPRFNAQAATMLFSPDGVRPGPAMRPKVEGTVARGATWDLLDDTHYTHGVWYAEAHEHGAPSFEFAEGLPVAVAARADADFLRRGRERYEMFCAPCHSVAGDGAGMVTRYAQSELMFERGVTWPTPADLVSADHTSLMIGRIGEHWEQPERLPEPADVFVSEFYRAELAELYAEHGVGPGDPLESEELAEAVQSLYGEARLESYVYSVIRNGFGNMGPYASQIGVEDRWAITLYVRALRASGDDQYRARLQRMVNDDSADGGPVGAE